MSALLIHRLSALSGSLAEKLARIGKGTSVAFFEFDTVESATRARAVWQGRVVNDDEKLIVRYADAPLAWRNAGGVAGRDHGGAKWNYGLVGGAPRAEKEAQLFVDVAKDEQVLHQRMITHYLRQKWRPSNSKEVHALVRDMVKRRTRRQVALEPAMVPAEDFQPWTIPTL